MDDLERRLRRALGGLPEGDEEARGRAERASLGQLPRRPSWAGRRAAIAAAAALAAVAIAGVSLAASGRLEVRVGEASPEPAPAAAGQLALPRGAHGVAVVAGGRLWLRTRTGLGISGLAVTSAELSPNALYAAVGIGRSLVAMSPDGRRAWTRVTPGPVIAIAWAPNPIWVAYLARAGDRTQLRLIEGDGEGDRLVDPDVAPVRPSWRADTHALAYVDSDGALLSVDPGDGQVRPLGRATAPGRVPDALAYAPSGERLAVAAGAATRLVLLGGGGPRQELALSGAGRAAGLAWSSPDALLVAERPAAGEAPRLLRVVPGRGKAQVASAQAPALAALAADPGSGGAALVALAPGADRRPAELWQIEPPARSTIAPLGPARVLLRLPGPAAITSISLR